MRILADPSFRNAEANPYNALLYHHLIQHGVDVAEYDARRALSGEYSILHIHWPESPFWLRPWKVAARRAYKKLRLVQRARRQGTKIVWTTHNLQSHERAFPWTETLFWRYFIRCVDGYISPSHTAMRAARKRYPRLRTVPGFVIPLGHYRDQYPAPLDRTSARAELGLPIAGKILVYFGGIRSYKNVPGLLQAFREFTDSAARLVVAGRPSESVGEEELRSAAAGDSRVLFDLRRIPDQVLHLYVCAADLVVLPFSAILNSSSALLALSLDRPILLPRRGAMGELQEAVGESWVRTFPGSLTSEEVSSALRWALETSREERAPLDAFEWSHIASETLRAYESIQMNAAARPG